MSDAIDRLLKNPTEWLRGGGPESEIVVSSRIRLARNLAGFPFISKLSKEQEEDIIDSVEASVHQAPALKDVLFIRYHEVTELDKQFLLERHLISREHAVEQGEKAVAVSPNEIVSLMVLEEDHLRLQVFQSGFNLTETWRIVNEIMNGLEKNLPFSFHANLGYLTACPTNVGTGIRASCMLHLPGLVLTKQVNKVIQALAKMNLATRGLYGEGSQAAGNFFQISNQVTLGQNEEEILLGIEKVIHQMIAHEKEARHYLMEKRKSKFEDQIWRALGTLKSSRIISSGEAVQLLSLVRLGVDLGFIAHLKHPGLNSLFLLIQPAHLQKMYGRALGASDRDIRRADLIREKMKGVEL
jgi:protein arginine kinase